MNIETKIDSRLWDAIRSSFENRNYTGSIQDSIYFLSDLIREKSGLEGDGTSLVGQAFGGSSPILKVNSLKTENDKNVQKGVEQLLRGLYQAVRNPRSHEKYADSEDDAISIILFINYLVRIIDKSKTPFLENIFISRVLDPSFVPKKRYAELLVNEIPEKKRMDIFYGVFRQLPNSDAQKLKYFFDALFDKVTEEEKREINNEVSDLLKTEEEIGNIRIIIQAFSDSWPKLDEAARLRIENKLIDNIKEGRWDPKTNKCRSGAFGTWATNITQYFALKDDLLYVLTNKLDNPNRAEQDYVFRFFSRTLCELVESPTARLKKIVIAGLKAGDLRFKELVESAFFWHGNEWNEPFKQFLESFEETSLPYDPEYDDDIPF